MAVHFSPKDLGLSTKNFGLFRTVRTGLFWAIP